MFLFFFFPDGDLWHLPSWQHDALAVQAWAASTCCWQRRRGSQVIKSHLRVASIRLISFNSIWLVVWNMAFSFPYIGNNDPNWLYNIVQRGWNHQPVYIYIYPMDPNTVWEGIWPPKSYPSRISWEGMWIHREIYKNNMVTMYIFVRLI